MVGLTCFFLNRQKVRTLILEKTALFVFIYGFNSHLKCHFNSILEKKHENFPCGALLLYVAHDVFIEVPLFQETCSLLSCAPVTFILTFHPSFHPNICFLQIYPFTEN